MDIWDAGQGEPPEHFCEGCGMDQKKCEQYEIKWGFKPCEEDE